MILFKSKPWWSCQCELFMAHLCTNLVSICNTNFSFCLCKFNFELITLTFSKCHHENFAQPFYPNMWSERIKHSHNAMYQKVCLNTLWQAFGDVSTSFNIFGLFLSFHHCWVFCYFGNTCTITCVTW